MLCAVCKDQNGFALDEGNFECLSCDGCEPGKCTPTGGCSSCSAGWLEDATSPGACIREPHHIV